MIDDNVSNIKFNTDALKYHSCDIKSISNRKSFVEGF